MLPNFSVGSYPTHAIYSLYTISVEKFYYTVDLEIVYQRNNPIYGIILMIRIIIQVD